MDKRQVPIHFYTKKRTRYGPVAQWIGRAWLRVFGWRLVGRNPGVPKCVVVCAPHTSNWDFPDALAAAMALSIPCVFMIKDSAFWWPLGVLLRWLGGIPINRRAPQGAVEQMAQVIRESERINVIITPEGTRRNAEFWKLGFYYIAASANVPILFGIGNRKERWIGVASLFQPTGNLEEDWKHIAEVFQRTVGVTPKYRTSRQGTR